MDTVSTVGGWSPPARHTLPASRPAGTLTIPLPLTHDLADAPQALGVYALIARLFAIHQRPIPLSAQDLAAYDPQLLYGRARRALQRLVRGGWLTQQHVVGQKASYLPTWGRGRAWDTAAPRAWGRPRRLLTLPLAARLLDTCLGKLIPHAQQPARLRRYLTTPLLSLADIGAYLLTLAGASTPTPALLRLGLTDQTQVRPLPSTEHLLCLGSQPQPEQPVAGGLTPAGLQRLGLACAAPPNPDSRPPLFFLPPDLIGSLAAPMTAHPTGLEQPAHAPSMPLAGHESASRPAAQRAPWNQANQTKQTTTGGGGAEERQQLDGPTAGAASPVALRLQALGVLPRQCQALAALDPALVETIVRYAEGCANIQSLPGLVVRLLRDAQTTGWRPPTPATPFLADPAKYTTGAYAGCFQIHRPAPAAPPLPEVPAPVVPPARAPDPTPVTAAPAATPPAWMPPDAAAVWRAVQAALAQQMTRQQFADGVGAAALVALAGSTVVLRAPTPTAHEQLGVRWRTLLARAFEAQLGYPVQIRLVLGG